MKKTKLIYQDLTRALAQLKISLQLPVDEIVRDATIQRFEFTVELAWKLLQAVLAEEGVEVASPRSAIRAAASNGLITETHEWFLSLDHRNLASHVYSEDLAKEIYTFIKGFPPLVENLLKSCEKLID